MSEVWAAAITVIIVGGLMEWMFLRWMNRRFDELIARLDEMFDRIDERMERIG